MCSGAASTTSGSTSAHPDSTASEGKGEDLRSRLEVLLSLRSSLHASGAAASLRAVDEEIATLKRAMLEVQPVQDRIPNL
eukprot:10492375-Lingulodinium_polyedra.AAC.1